jgi:hypothetical protein
MSTESENPGGTARRPTGAASVLRQVQCPRCGAGIDVQSAAIACPECKTPYPRLGSVPILVPQPERYLLSCRRRLESLEEEVTRAIAKIREEMEGGDVLPLTRARCRGMIEGMRRQLADVKAIVEPVLPSGLTVLEAEEPFREAPVSLEYLPYLYRDWGWPPEVDGENERAVETVLEVLGSAPPGRTLVLGAGACRLPYELHLRFPDSEFVLLDLDPVLFTAAARVVGGEPLSVLEGNLEVCDLDQEQREWALSPGRGPADKDRFHLLIADGLEPPFPPHTFNTVLTPWFIDQVPGDVRDFIPTVHRLLRPGGRWVNLGPLQYEPDVPVTLRFSRDELFDLLARAGFRVERWRTESGTYLVSKLNGRGKVEWVLAFSAEKSHRPPEAPGPTGGPPAWLLFRHLPVPTFEGQTTLRQGPALFRLVVSSIDGVRTLDDLARIVAEHSRSSGFSMGQIRQAVRQCLVQVHPECEAGAP